jgi:hydroxylamine oxidation protein HaoB
MGCCALDQHTNPAAGWLPRVFGILLVAVGGYILLVGLPQRDSAPRLSWRRIDVIERGRPEFGSPAPAGAADRLLRYRVSRGKDAALVLDVAEYRDSHDRPARAMVYPASTAPGDAGLRHDLWQEAMAAIRTHTPADALFLGWWDNGQRVAYASGRPVWAGAPAAELYPDAGQRSLWRELAGGFAENPANLKQLASWLLLDADAALAEMAAQFPGRSVYLLICLDDLARLTEIETAGGVMAGIETRLFPPAANLHRQIAAVRQWTAAEGTGNYLVQRLGSGSTRAWRIARPEATRSLLARLLPFTRSLAEPLHGATLVYQSAWGAYLSIYRLDFPAPAAALSHWSSDTL